MPKKKPIEIIEKIFKILKQKNQFTINEIAKKTNSHWSTINEYVDIIKYIQKQPKLVETLTKPNLRLVRLEK